MTEEDLYKERKSRNIMIEDGASNFYITRMVVGIAANLLVPLRYVFDRKYLLNIVAYGIVFEL